MLFRLLLQKQEVCMSKQLCPCCMRHCYLDDLHCPREKEYKETGVIPPRKPRPEGAGENKRPNEAKMKYIAMNKDEKLVFSIMNAGELLSALNENERSEAVLSCLREEDRNDLLMLLEKLRHSLHHR